MSTYCLNHTKALIHGSLSKLDVPSGVLQAPVVAPMFSTMNRLLEKRVLNSTPESTGWERLGEVTLESRIRTHIDLHRLESLPEINKLHCNKDKYKMQSWDKRQIKCMVCEMRNNRQGSNSAGMDQLAVVNHALGKVG